MSGTGKVKKITLKHKKSAQSAQSAQTSIQQQLSKKRLQLSERPQKSSAQPQKPLARLESSALSPEQENCNYIEKNNPVEVNTEPFLQFA